MLSVYCPRHGERVLLTERRVRAVHNTDDGIVLEVECYDGQRIFLATGRTITDGGRDRVQVAKRAVASVADPSRDLPTPRLAAV